MDCFPESWTRINRAVLHLKAFQAEWERVVDPKACEILTKVNDDWTSGEAKAVIKNAPKNVLAVELGEFFYQMRAALDALIYQAAMLLEGADPPSNEDSLYFPICRTSRGFRDSAINAPPFPEKLRDWLESIQPYKAPETADSNTLNLIRRLKLLNDCARRDRHRRLHFVGAVPANFDCRFECDQPTVGIVNGRINIQNLLEYDGPFFLFDIEGADRTRPINLKMKSALVLQISVDQIRVPDGGRLDSEIREMGMAVERVVRYFEDGFQYALSGA